jgi:DUF2934 family protein
MKLHPPIASAASISSTFTAKMNYSHDSGECGGRCLVELIRARAYQFFEARGRQEGHAFDDWLSAEHEVKQHLGFELPCHEKQKPSS